MARNEEKEHNLDLYRYILELKDEEECFRFFHDLCSLKEMYSLEQRFEVARMLYNENVYTAIMQETNASTATISRVKRVLHYGKDGLLDVFDRMSGKDVSDENK